MLPFPWKPHYTWLAGFAVCALILCSIVGGIVSAVKDYRHDKITEDLKIERQEDIRRGDEAEARATAAEAEKVKFQLALELAGKDTKIAIEKVQNAESKFNQELESIDAPVSECERYTRLRAKLDLKPAPCQ